MTVTVETLRTLARQRADMLNSQFVSATEWISYINYSYKELYDILVSKFEDYYSVEYPFSITTGNSAALPSNFYKMRGVDRALGADEFYTVRPFSFEDRNNRRRVQFYRGLYPTVRYRILGNNILFTPDDNAVGDYRLWFIPRASDLTVASDVVDGVNGWEEYVVVDAAIKALQKEESDVSVLMAQKQALLLRINDMANNRDAGESDRITDITTSYDDFPLGSGGGW